MTSVELKVPYHEKELAKARGALWDPQRKTWYVAGQDLAPFEKWLPQPPRINHRSDSYVLLESRRVCWNCGVSTRVFGFAIPCGYERFQESSGELEFSSDAEYEAWLDGPEAMQWVAAKEAAILSYVTYVSAAVLSRMRSLTLRYRKDFSGVTGTWYFMNHCEQCDAKLGDFETIEEYDAPLRPIGTSSSRLSQYPVTEPLEAESSSAPLVNVTLQRASARNTGW